MAEAHRDHDNQTTNYGLATAIAFDHQHQRLECRGPGQTTTVRHRSSRAP
ncbi:MAG: hypothetical protein R2722_02610 [Tessaracoccus sp.]